MMKRIIALALLLSFGIVSLPAVAQQRKRQAAASGQAPFQIRNANIWKVSGKGLKSPSYVMGTIHLICTEKYDWSSRLEKAYGQTRQVCVELDITDPAVQMEIFKGMKAPEGKGLSTYFTPEEYRHLDTLVQEKMGVSLKALEGLSPGILSSIFALQSFSCPNTQSYDMDIINMAKKDGKKVHSLETAAQQVAVLEKMTEGEELDRIKLYLNDNSRDSIGRLMTQEIEQLMQYYVTEDLAGLEQYFMNPDHISEAARPALTDDRNQAWIPQMEVLMKEQPTFFAVGIAHLVGPQGVLQLLHQLGYTVEPVL